MTVRVAVAVGGVSSERPVSLKTGAAVARALKRWGHDVTVVDVRQRCVAPLIAVDPDVVFLALHGTYGEDGLVQHQLDQAKLTYTGSGAIASRRAMDKALAKERFWLKRIPTAPSLAFTPADARTTVEHFTARETFPIVIKPVSQGSSLGVSIVNTPGEVDAALESAFAYDSRAMVERFIAGRELTVGVLDGHPLPIVEIKANRDFFDYDAKYDPDAGARCAPCLDLRAHTVVAVQQAAVAAYHALECSGGTRVDLILNERGVPVILEVNTIPGMTETSLLPIAADAGGLSFEALCGRLVELARRDAICRDAEEILTLPARRRRAA